MTQLAPIVLFTYKRLEVTKRVVQSLLANAESSQSTLIVYSDGPRSSSDISGVQAVRDYMASVRGFRDVEFIHRTENLGLAESFIRGIAETLERHERAIFLEDDDLLSEHFLSFMNGALSRYENDRRVCCITGYSYPVWPAPSRPYFLRAADVWSMATWRHGWAHFNRDAAALLEQIDRAGLRGRFKADGFGMYEMLKQQVRGEINSWGIRWWAGAFVDDVYCLYPPQPLCVPIGYGSESVHCAEYSLVFRSPSELADEPVTDFPNDVYQPRVMTLLLRLMNFRLRWVPRFQRFMPWIFRAPESS